MVIGYSFPPILTVIRRVAMVRMMRLPVHQGNAVVYLSNEAIDA